MVHLSSLVVVFISIRFQQPSCEQISFQNREELKPTLSLHLYFQMLSLSSLSIWSLYVFNLLVLQIGHLFPFACVDSFLFQAQCIKQLLLINCTLTFTIPYSLLSISVHYISTFLSS